MTQRLANSRCRRDGYTKNTPTKGMEREIHRRKVLQRAKTDEPVFFAQVPKAQNQPRALSLHRNDGMSGNVPLTG
jgi:hypothetical protein